LIVEHSSRTKTNTPLQIMNPDDVLLLGLKASVTAVSKADGKKLWKTQLPGGMGDGFVTLLSDGTRIFAHSQGRLHCLDAESGKILWSNGLPGYGFGLASLAFPRNASSPATAAVRHLEAQKRTAD
jgi:outer membrane protein assembly factor BamB